MEVSFPARESNQQKLNQTLANIIEKTFSDFDSCGDKLKNYYPHLKYRDDYHNRAYANKNQYQRENKIGKS